MVWSSYSVFDHDHDILVESRSWILHLVSEPRGSRSRILQDGSYWSRTITTGTGLDSYWFYNVPPGHHGYCWSYHVPPGSMTLVSPGSVMIPSGRFPATVQGQNSNDFVTDGVSLNAMGGRKTAVATLIFTGFCPETAHFQQDEFDVTCDHFMEPTFEIDMHFFKGEARSLLELIAKRGEMRAWIGGNS
ncbi:hypothetical protein Tco_1345537 [Tanacetum coccineum]